MKKLLLATVALLAWAWRLLLRLLIWLLVLTPRRRRPWWLRSTTGAAFILAPMVGGARATAVWISLPQWPRHR